jgi:hypothetical protein
VIGERNKTNIPSLPRRASSRPVRQLGSVFNRQKTNKLPKSVFLKAFFPRGASSKTIVCVPRNPCLSRGGGGGGGGGDYKETVIPARKLLRYFQLSDKNSRHISRYIYIFFLRSFKIFIYLFHSFSRNPKQWFVEPSGAAEPSLTNTDLY